MAEGGGALGGWGGGGDDDGCWSRIALYVLSFRKRGKGWPDELDTLPRPLFIRALVMGTLLGGATSGLQAAQDYVGRLRVEQALHEPKSDTSLPPPEQEKTAGGSIARGDVRVDRPAQVGEKMGGVPVDETRPDPGQAAASGGGSSWYSWIPGIGK
jgi:hypothetical protein